MMRRSCSGRLRQDGAARRRARAASTAARSPASIDPQSPRARRRRSTIRRLERRRRGDRFLDRRTRSSTNVPALARRGINLVIGTTGWQAARSRRCGRRSPTPASASSPRRISRPASCCSRRSSRMRRSCSRAQSEFGAFLHEAHHAAKKDAPSGTALLLKRSMEQAGYAAADRRRRRRAPASSPARTRSASTARRKRSR